MEENNFPHEALTKQVLIDSRQLSMPKETIFFAFKGHFQDGHDFILPLYQQGVRWFVGEKELPKNYTERLDFQYIQTKSCLKALHYFSSKRRKNFKYPLIAITGSNGKTIVKEWLYQILSPDYEIIKSPKSYNSQLGVPLSLSLIEDKHNLGIFEAGISKPEEMVKLWQVLRPTLGIFTNLGTAHDAFFKDKKEKLTEKIKLFKNAESVIYCKDQNFVDEVFTNHHIPSFSWSIKSKKADLNFKLSFDFQENKTFIFKNQKSPPIILPFTNTTALENAFHCIAFMTYLGYEDSIIAKRIQNLKALERRLNIKSGLNHCLLIDDSYNNDLVGFKLALDFLSQQKQNKKQSVIFSDILETKQIPSKLYATLNSWFLSKKINKIIGIGQHVFEEQKQFLSPECYFFKNVESFIKSKLHFQDEAILIKGARVFKLERITQLLEASKHQTELRINLNNLLHNLLVFKSFLKPTTKIMVMVKAFAYGNGLKEVAHLLQNQGVHYLGVAYVDEGMSLRNSGIYIPILVANPDINDFELFINKRLEPQISNFQSLHALIDDLEKYQPSYRFPIQLKFDTGMHRLGFYENDLQKLIPLLKTCKYLIVQGVISHLSSADSVSQDRYTLKQIQDFKNIVYILKMALGYSFLSHILNSAGIIRFSDFQMDMVRLGIGLYGISPVPSFQNRLQNVATLKSYIVSIKILQAGESVGYSGKGVLKRTTKLATVAIGYADGFKRAFSNKKAAAFLKNRKVDIIGHVCMDMTMIDATDLDIQLYDEVIFFGEEPSWTEQASKVDTIPYELISQINTRVKRVFYMD